MAEVPLQEKEFPKSNWSCSDQPHALACKKLLDEVHNSSLSSQEGQKAMEKAGIPAKHTNADGSVTTHELTKDGGFHEHTYDPAEPNNFYNKDSYFYSDPAKNSTVERLGGDTFRTDSRGVTTQFSDPEMTRPRRVINPDGTYFDNLPDDHLRERELHYGPSPNQNYNLYKGGKNSEFASLNFSNIYKEAAPGLLKIENARGGGGSGVMVGKSEAHGCLAVTADHVIRSNINDPDGVALKPGLSATTADGSKHKIDVLARDPQHDLALIGLEDASNVCRPVAVAEQPVQPGDKVVHMGFLPRTDRMTVTPGIVSDVLNSGCPSLEGVAASETKVAYVESTRFAIGAQHGMSGGATVNNNGKLVGIVDAGNFSADASESTTCIVGATRPEIEQFLKNAENNLPGLPRLPQKAER